MALIRGDIIEHVDVPHEDGEWFDFRRLTGKQVEAAAESRQRVALRTFRDLGAEGMEALSAQQASNTDAAADPLAAVDKWQLLYDGITAWSYDAPVSRDMIDKLDSKTADWAAREVARMSIVRDEDARKND